MGEAQVHAIVVTYRRPVTLEATLRSLYEQSRRPDHLWVVDNAADETVALLAESLPATTYLPMTENLGPAGGIARGMQKVLDVASDDDWILLVDDDDPPTYPDVVKDLVAFAEQESTTQRLGGVGVRGSRYRRNRGMLRRIPEEQVRGTVPVDYIGGNKLPLYRVRAVREVGPFAEPFFFGFDDSEYGLRLRLAGWELLVSGAIIDESNRHEVGLWTPEIQRAAHRLAAWRRYYSSRNAIVIARRYATPVGLTLAVFRFGALSPVRLLLRGDVSGAWAAIRGALHGVMGRLGRTVEPAPKANRS